MKTTISFTFDDDTELSKDEIIDALDKLVGLSCWNWYCLLPDLLAENVCHSKFALPQFGRWLAEFWWSQPSQQSGCVPLWVREFCVKGCGLDRKEVDELANRKEWEKKSC